MRNLVVIPYHDWRKITQEGARTRDAHFIEKFRSSNAIEKLIIINRPITYAEILLKRKPERIEGKIILKEKGCRLIAIDDKTFVIDTRLPENIAHLIQKRKWYFRGYRNPTFTAFILKCLKVLSIDKNYYLLSQNILASQLINHLYPKKIFFDAWDNFRLMPSMKNIYSLLDEAYINYSKRTNHWYTNSLENIHYYKKNYLVKSISLLKNGVDYNRFNKIYEKPDDLKVLKKPLIGFGGKITHLFDVELFNYLVLHNPDLDFVVIGQILDQNIFNSIEKRPNFHYLGDKHYSQYPAYVKNFQTCIVPYVTGEKQHGADSIKAYEYLAAGKKVIGTRGSGLQDLSENLFVADSHEEFSQFLKAKNEKLKFNAEEHSWSKKAEKIIQDFDLQE